MSLLTNLVSYWKLDGNSTDGVGSNNGTDTSITYSAGNGKIVQGAGFNGSSSKIVFTSSASLTPATFTISAWIYITGTPPNAYTIYGADVSYGGIVFKVDNSRKLAVDKSNMVNILAGTNLVPINQWVHVLCTYTTGTGVCNAYINGTLDKTTTNAQTFTQVAQTIGKNWNEYFSGALDEVGLWNRALSAAEVTSLYNGGAGLAYPFTGNKSNFFQFM